MTRAGTAATAIHALIERCRAGELPSRVARMRSGWVLLAERQVRSGYCLLLADPAVEHLQRLDPGPRAQFLLDMSAVGDALMACTGAIRINYAIYGNLDPALHAHVFPRFADEPEAERTQQPWGLDWSRAPLYEPARDEPLRARLAAALASSAASAWG